MAKKTVSAETAEKAIQDACTAYNPTLGQRLDWKLSGEYGKATNKNIYYNQNFLTKFSELVKYAYLTPALNKKSQKKARKIISIILKDAKTAAHVKNNLETQAKSKGLSDTACLISYITLKSKKTTSPSPLVTNYIRTIKLQQALKRQPFLSKTKRQTKLNQALTITENTPQNKSVIFSTLTKLALNTATTPEYVSKLANQTAIKWFKEKDIKNKIDLSKTVTQSEKSYWLALTLNQVAKRRFFSFSTKKTRLRKFFDENRKNPDSLIAWELHDALTMLLSTTDNKNTAVYKTINTALKHAQYYINHHQEQAHQAHKDKQSAQLKQQREKAATTLALTTASQDTAQTRKLNKRINIQREKIAALEEELATKKTKTSKSKNTQTNILNMLKKTVVVLKQDASDDNQRSANLSDNDEEIDLSDSDEEIDLSDSDEAIDLSDDEEIDLSGTDTIKLNI